jgi:hypothetical protein
MTWIMPPLRTLTLVIGVIGCLVSGPGCAVLTQSQIDEVNRFAAATKQYDALPGEPIRQYWSLTRMNKLLELAGSKITSTEDAASNWGKLTKAIAQASEFSKQGVEADQTLEVLTRYADGLHELISQDSLDKLDKSATAFGTSFDKAVSQYNKVVGQANGQSDLKLVGASVAGGIRAAGGVFIRTKQAAYLKSFIKEAAPIIEAHTTATVILMDKMHGNLDIQRQRLETNFKALSVREQVLAPDTVALFGDTLAKINAADELCGKTKAAAEAYAAAHTKLVSMVETRQDLKSDIEEITVLIDQIKAGLKTKKALEK